MASVGKAVAAALGAEGEATVDVEARTAVRGVDGEATAAKGAAK